jgi:transposase
MVWQAWRPKKHQGVLALYRLSSEGDCLIILTSTVAVAKGGRLTGEAIRLYIADEFQINYHPNAIYKLLHLLGFSWITSRSKHPKQSEEAQKDFKKNAN